MFFPGCPCCPLGDTPPSDCCPSGAAETYEVVIAGVTRDPGDPACCDDINGTYEITYVETPTVPCGRWNSSELSTCGPLFPAMVSMDLSSGSAFLVVQRFGSGGGASASAFYRVDFFDCLGDNTAHLTLSPQCHNWPATISVNAT